MAKRNSVQVTLTNRQAWVTEASEAVYETLRDFWSFYPPGYRWARSYKLYARERAKAIKAGEPDRKVVGWDGKIRMFQKGRLPAGLFRATKKLAEETLGVTFQIDKRLPQPLDFIPGIVIKEEKYQYQPECVAKMCAAVRRGGGIVLAATASGKTSIASQFFSRLTCSCLFVVDQIDLLYQSQEELAKWLGEQVGVVGDSEFSVKRITVATIQTLKLHLQDKKFQLWFKKVQVVVVDELHEQMARRNFGVLETIKPIARFGLTATLQLGQKHVRTRAYAFAGPVIFRFPITKGQELGVLSRGTVTQLLFEEVFEGTDKRTPAERYTEEVIENELKQSFLYQAVRYLVEQGRYVIVLVDRIAHLDVITKLFQEVAHRVAWGGIRTKDRKTAKAKFEKGDIRLIIASDVFKKGVNIKRVDAMFDLAERPSKNNAIQKFGRGVRLHPDKSELAYYDFGTQVGKLAKGAKSRARAFKKEGIPIKKVKVTSAAQAMKALKKSLGEI